MTPRSIRAEQPNSHSHGQVRIIRPLELVSHAVSGPGVSRMAAITHELVGAETMWVGLTILQPGKQTDPHHHDDHETGICVLAGRVQLRWGSRLESEAEVEAGDLAFVPPLTPHCEINPSADEPTIWLAIWNPSKAHVLLTANAEGIYSRVATSSDSPHDGL